MENRLHTVIGILFALLFLAFAIVQYNDPDPLTWILVYGFMVVLHLVSIRMRLSVVVSLLPMGAAIVGAFLLWPDEYIGLTGKMDSRPAVEFARESLGLAVCALGCAYVFVRSWMRAPKRPF
jgi:hypothetical protein